MNRAKLLMQPFGMMYGVFVRRLKGEHVRNLHVLRMARLNTCYVNTSIGFQKNLTPNRSFIKFSPVVLKFYFSPQKRLFSSFVSEVMAQVHKDLETNPKLRQSLQEFQKSQWNHGSRFLNEFQQSFLMRLGYFKTTVEMLVFKLLKHSSYLLSPSTKILQQAVKHIIDDLELKKLLMNVNLGFQRSFDWVLSGLKHVLANFEDESPRLTRTRVERWRKSQCSEDKEKRESSMADEAERQRSREKNNEGEKSLTIIKESGWEVFGTTLRDMPFLRKMFAHPALEAFFSENLLSSVLSEIKKSDPTFKFFEFLQLVEHVIVPQVLKSFLVGDREVFKMQCRQDVYSLIDHYFKERETLKISLDPTVLRLYNIEFRGAAKAPDSDQCWLVFTFVAQQINCLRNEDNTIVQGAIDDIREVMYSVALQRHPEPNRLGLFYPWQITEFAIVGNTPYW